MSFAPDDCVHTLVAVLTDEGLTGYGSVFSNDGLVKASLKVLEPALSRRRTRWSRSGSVRSCTNIPSGSAAAARSRILSAVIDIALWDILGQVTGQPVGRLLGGRYRDRVQPYASILMEQPGPLADQLAAIKAQGFRAFKIGWGPFGRESYALDEAIVRAAREAIGSECKLMVDAGGSDAFWPHGYKWALRTAAMLAGYDVTWFEEPLKPDALADYVALRRAASVPISGGEVLTPAGRHSNRGWRLAHSTSSSRM